ncbi:hypothetical protein LOD99_8487 [Oopsacas minuta]|uniref:Helitron helicase-like domain-containing protein n=1 Tax=Oopsacas minuta TaxID=111878 RepID=A0AAV7JG30_9METZ|nr:hypothetical protein LOD99_8487 [Oopsacas minuta]
MDFYAYRFILRDDNFNLIHRRRTLFNQIVVDMYAKVETERLLFIRLHQKKLRVDDYIHLRDAVVTDGNPHDFGKLVILPSSFTGSPRYMHEGTQDAMTYVRNYGRPDLSIAFTCNPLWPEITESLMMGQKPHNRHDIVARVFKQKLLKYMDLLTKGVAFRKTMCHMYSIEWQKRGLPHSHILIWLREKIRPHNHRSMHQCRIS